MRCKNKYSRGEEICMYIYVHIIAGQKRVRTMSMMPRIKMNVRCQQGKKQGEIKVEY